MDDFKDVFSTFHESLKQFVNEFSHNLTCGAPCGLQKVDVIPDLLTPDNEELLVGDVDTLCKKFVIQHDLVVAIAERCCDCVGDDFKEKFEKELQRLQYHMYLCKLAIGNLRLAGDPDPEDQETVLSCGIGGINPGVQARTHTAVMGRLDELIPALKSLPKK